MQATSQCVLAPVDRLEGPRAFGACGRLGPWVAVMVAAALTACASGSYRGSSGGLGSRVERDGPEANPPPDLARVPDAEPKVEPIRSGGPNKPYDVLGRSYVPLTQDKAFTERGMASWYGRAFQGKRTASGEIYNMYAMTAAHPTLPIPSYARVRNPANGREIVVRINDRGPFHAGRIVDLSYTAALKLELLRGVAPVELQRITFEEIRTGSWRREGDVEVLGTGAPAAVQRINATTGLASPPAWPAGPEAAAALPPAQGSPVLAAPPELVATAASPGGAASAASPLPAAEVKASLGTSGVVPGAEPGREAVADAPAARAFTAPARGFWVQLGAFRVRDGAESFQQRVAAELDWLAPLLAVFNDSSMYHLQAGPYPSRDEARVAAERVRDALLLVPVIVQRR